MNSIEHNIARIQDWSQRVGIYAHSTLESQALKGVSEMGEVADAIVKKDRMALADGIGDVIVCLVNVAVLAGIDIAMAFDGVVEEVSKRNGRMVKGGAFIKDVE